jgi:hypothetical protein
MTSVGVAALVLALLKLVNWLATPAHPTVPSYSGIVVPPYSGIVAPQTTPLPPGLNLSGRYDSPNWGPVPNFAQTGRNGPNTSQ